MSQASSTTGSVSASAQQIVDTLHEPLIVLDPDLRVRQANPAFYQAFTLSPEETIGRPLFEIGDGPFDHPALRPPLETLIENHQPFEAVTLEAHVEGLGRRVLRVNGRMLSARGDAPEPPPENTPEDTPEGTSKDTAENAPEEASGQILLAINDVTEQQRLEEKLRQRAQALTRSNEDLEQFAYAASHDLQEPLRMVSSYLQLLERRYAEDLDETAREFIGYAVDGADRMKALINGLLQYSRVGRKEGEFGTVDLNSVLDDILGDLNRRIEELGATVETEPLPAPYGNRDQLRRLLQNLIENALTYHGDKPPVIFIRGDEDEEGVHLVVRDEGPGIPPEAQEKVFQIFGQLDPHGTGQQGSGMGLALCKKIAERHNGDIWVESEPGTGSAFHVTLHLSPPNDSRSNDS